MAGLLDFVNRGMANPLTHLGMGLMASSQPRYSTNIADLNGGGIGSGLLTGMDSFQRYQQNQSDMDYRQGILGAKQKKLMADEEDEARRRQGLQALLATVKDPEKRMVLSGLLSSGADPASAFKTVNPEPGSLPSAVQEYEYAKGQGYNGTFEQWQVEDANRKRPTNTINNFMGGNLATRPLTPDEEKLLPEDADPKNYRVDAKGVIEPIPRSVGESASLTNAARSDEAFKGGDNLLQAYVDAAKEYKNQTGLGILTGERGRAETAKEALAAYIAKTVLGTPGAEPTPALYDKARAMIPDFAGPIDGRNFEANLKQLKKMMEAKAKSQPKAFPQPPPGSVRVK